MAVDVAQVRSFVEELLRENKGLTEREVKAAIAKKFRKGAADVTAGVIRDVRKGLGIDRPSALEYVGKLLSEKPALSAKAVIDSVGQRFGVRLGAPDVSRLRPSSRPKPARPGPGRPARKPDDAVDRAAGGPKARAGSRGSISVTFQGTGSARELATFFLELGRKRGG
jgi:hypothetical protein